MKCLKCKNKLHNPYSIATISCDYKNHLGNWQVKLCDGCVEWLEMFLSNTGFKVSILLFNDKNYYPNAVFTTNLEIEPL